MQGQLGLEGIPDRLVRVTPARLATWARCPRQYRMTYLDKSATARSAPWAHSTLGAVVHNVLRALVDLPAAQRSAERAASLLHRYWKSDGFADPEQVADYKGRAQRWLSDYVSGWDGEFSPVAVEHWVSARTGTIIAEGRVDRIDDRDGELVIVDYKTGRHAVRVDDARNSQALALYALAAGSTMRRPCRRVELHHLPTGEVASWEHTAQSLAEHRARAEAQAAEIREATDRWESGDDHRALFPARPGKHCSTCDFRQQCAEGRDAAPALRSWELLGV